MLRVCGERGVFLCVCVEYGRCYCQVRLFLCVRRVWDTATARLVTCCSRMLPAGALVRGWSGCPWSSTCCANQPCRNTSKQCSSCWESSASSTKCHQQQQQWQAAV